MYILANKSRLIVGIFTSKKKLNNAIKVIGHFSPDTKMYYAEFKEDYFDPLLPNFFTMHPERLIEIKYNEYETV